MKYQVRHYDKGTTRELTTEVEGSGIALLGDSDQALFVVQNGKSSTFIIPVHQLISCKAVKAEKKVNQPIPLRKIK